MELLLTTIFGEKCFFCGKVGRIICYGCESKIKLCKTGVCIKCQDKVVLGHTHPICQQEAGNKLPSQLCSVYQYDGLVREVIKKSKYSPKRFALLRVLSASAAKMASKLGLDFTGFTVVPIPISKAREKDRGFNQAEIIAKAVCKEFGLAMDNSILTRIRDTNKQFGLHKYERGQNVIGAFAVTKSFRRHGSVTISTDRNSTNPLNKINKKADLVNVPNKFLLVDDICTTGSTLIEASRVLYDAGAEDVRCFTLSRKI